MKVKIISTELEDFEEEFKVRRMNYDQVVVNYPTGTGIKVFNNKDVEFISESKIDEFLISNKDLLKIKLNRGVSVTLYKAILDDLEEEFKIIFKNLILLRDNYTVNKRGIWDKEIVCIVNDIIPLKIIANGQNFKKSNFNIEINQMSKEDFLELCTYEINKIRKEISKMEQTLATYGMAIKNLEDSKNIVKMLV